MPRVEQALPLPGPGKTLRQLAKSVGHGAWAPMKPSVTGNNIANYINITRA